VAGDAVGCTADDLVWRLGDELWEVELDEPVTSLRNELRAPGGRLVRRIETWTPAVARDLIAACAQRVREHPSGNLSQIQLDEFADDVVRYASEARSEADGASVGAYVAAHAIAGGDKAAIGYASRFEKERHWQAEWLKERLLL
jgi:hypothetical protein